MSTITPEIRDRLRADLRATPDACCSGDHARSWEPLAEAHVLSEPWAVWHVRVHGSMLAGAREGDGREVWGQIVRLVVAGPGSFGGRDPVGNVGRATVPATQSMPICDDVAELLREAGR